MGWRAETKGHCPSNDQQFGDDKFSSKSYILLGMTEFTRADGVTPSERYLQRLCDQSFLSLWSYPGIYRDQGGGKEVCDLLVVFDQHILIFSDKYCEFPDTGNVQLDWNRWFRKAVQKSANQIWGAERWIQENPHRLFLDRHCKIKFPFDLPSTEEIIFHRIVVAHGVSNRCRSFFNGGSGSLMINPSIVGEAHYKSIQESGCGPFVVGLLDSAKGFVHVLDDTTLDIVLQTRDTVSDFVEYLCEKENFLLSGQLTMAAGEEELLAYYLSHYDQEKKKHTFDPPPKGSIFLDQGFWQHFIENPSRKRQLEANRISYVWDEIIEKFTFHALNGTQHFTSHTGLAHQEKLLRYIARESRTRRRMLSRLLIEFIERIPPGFKATRVFLPETPKDPYYLFLLLPENENVSHEVYRTVRRNLLEASCLILKLKYPRALDIIGLATETGKEPNNGRSEDLLYFDARNWSPDMQSLAEQRQKDLNLQFPKFQPFAVNEYPFD